MPMVYETYFFPVDGGEFPDPPRSWGDDTPQLKRLIDLMGNCVEDYSGHKAYHFVSEHGWHMQLFQSLYRLYDHPEWDDVTTAAFAFVEGLPLEKMLGSLSAILDHLHDEFPVGRTEQFAAELIRPERSYREQFDSAKVLAYGDWDLTYDLSYTITGFVSFLRSLHFSIEQTIHANQTFFFANVP